MILKQYAVFFNFGGGAKMHFFALSKKVCKRRLKLRKNCHFVGLWLVKDLE